MSQESLDCELPYYTVDQLRNEARSQALQLGIDAAISFCSQGYYFLAGHNEGNWRAVHAWCEDNFERYNWAGSTFAFLNEQDAVMFKLRWG